MQSIILNQSKSLVLKVGATVPQGALAQFRGAVRNNEKKYT